MSENMTPHPNRGRAALPARGSTIAKQTAMGTDGSGHATLTAVGIHHKKKLPRLTFFFFKEKDVSRKVIHTGTSVIFGRDLKVQIFFISADGVQTTPIRGLGY